MSLHSFSSADSSVEAVLEASLNQIKRLILLCRLECPRTLCSLFLSGAPMHILSAVLSEPEAGPEWRPWLMLGIQTYQDLYVCYPVHLDIIQGYVAMALKTGAMSSSEATEVVEQTKARGRHHKAVEEAVGLFTIDFRLALTDPEDARAHSLALKFGELALFNDVTGGEYTSTAAGS